MRTRFPSFLAAILSSLCVLQFAEAQQYSPSLFQGMHWRMVGPFRGGRTRPASWRRSQLEALKRLLKKEESSIFEALWADLRKPRLEG